MSVLHNLGMSLGPFELIGANESNKFGHFEPVPVNTFNMELQRRVLGYDGDMPNSPEILRRLLATEGKWSIESTVSSEELERGPAMIRQILESGTVSGFKDPRVPMLWPYWGPVVQSFSDVARPVLLMLLRSPHEIAMSIFTRSKGICGYYDALDVTAVHLARMEAIATDWPGEVAVVRFDPRVYRDDLQNAAAVCRLTWEDAALDDVYDPLARHHDPVRADHPSQLQFDRLARLPEYSDQTENGLCLTRDAMAREKLMQLEEIQSRQEILGLRAALAQTRNECVVMRGENHVSRTECRNLRSTVENLEFDRQRLQTELDALAQERDGLQATLDAGTQEREALRSALDAGAQEQETLQSALDAATQERKALRSALDDATQEREALRSALDAGMQEQEALRSALDDVTQEREDLRRSFNDAVQAREAASEIADETTREISHLHTNLERIRSERDSTRGELEALNRHMTGRCEDIETECEGLRATCESLQTAKDLAEEKVAKFEANPVIGVALKMRRACLAVRNDRSRKRCA